MRLLPHYKKLGLIIIILGIFQAPAFAYIDPGTGSMLFSVVLGVMTTLFFLVNSLFIKLKMLFLSKKDLVKNNIPFVIYSEGKQYFNVFEPIINEFEARKIPLVFYTSSEDDPVFRQKYEYIKAEYIGQAFEAYMKLAFLKADVCLMTTPGLDVYHLKRSKYVKYYCHIFHSVATSLMYRLFSLDYYDGVLCNGEFQPALIRELEQKRDLPAKDIEVPGCTYLDVLADKVKNLPKKDDIFTVLVAPSWGENSILNKYGVKFLDKLAESGFRVVIRPHPQSLKVDKKLIENLEARYKNNNNISWNYDVENLHVLSSADIMISDFSGVIFDYVFLFNRPVIYINYEFNKEIYDLSDLDEEGWNYRMIKKLGTELTKDNFEDIVGLINESVNKSNPELIEKIKHIAWANPHQSGKYAADFLIRKQKELTEC